MSSPRVLAALWLAAMLHLLCLVLLTMQHPVLPQSADAMFDIEFASAPAEAADLPGEKAFEALAPTLDEVVGVGAPPRAQKPLETQPSPRVEPPKTQPKPAETALAPLPPLSPPTMAFDESKTTKEVPNEAYLSDRTSTAADRGPKELPRGDPYLDKGQSDAVRALQKRGEGELPAIPSDAASGSVKREGTPDAGKAERESGRTGEGERARAEEEKTPRRGGAETAGRTTPDSAPWSQDSERERLRAGDGEPLKQTEAAKPRTQDSALGTQDSEPGPRTRLDELGEFRAQLEGNEGRAGNTEGEKPGTRGRTGEKGHEGDGTPRPGHGEAVSDVNTFNLDSSAAEFDEARFAKIKDPVATYFKPLFRRIDGKWKAEIVARNRMRFLRGVVRMKVVVLKNGELKEAAEVSRLPSDLPDEYAAIAKLAIQRAAEKKSEPFPPELAQRETLEITIGFIY